MLKTSTYFYDTPNGKLTKDIRFVKDKKEIVIKSGTPVRIDPERGIALFGKDHFVIFSGEYRLFDN